MNMRRAQYRSPDAVDELDDLLDDVGSEFELNDHSLDDGTALIFTANELESDTADDVEQALHRALGGGGGDDSSEE